MIRMPWRSVKFRRFMDSSSSLSGVFGEGDEQIEAEQIGQWDPFFTLPSLKLVTSSFLFLVVRPGAPSSFLFLVASCS